MNCENQALILLKFHKLASFNDVITAKRTELMVKNWYGPRLLAEFVLGPRLGKGCRHLIYTQCLPCATGKERESLLAQTLNNFVQIKAKALGHRKKPVKQVVSSGAPRQFHKAYCFDKVRLIEVEYFFLISLVDLHWRISLDFTSRGWLPWKLLALLSELGGQLPPSLTMRLQVQYGQAN